MSNAVSLPAAIAAQSRKTPDATYLNVADTGESVSYAEVDRQARAWAAAYARAGLGPGDTALTMLPPIPEAVAAWLGIAWLHALEVPINTGYRGRMLQYVIDDSQATTMLAHADYAPFILADLPEDSRLTTLIVVGGDLPEGTDRVRVLSADAFLADADPVDLTEPQAHEISAIIYTSGTTGPSKGVMLPWAQVIATGEGITPPALFGPEDAFYSPFPMFHMSGKGPLCSMAGVGGRVVLKSRFDTKTFWSDIRTYGVTTTILLGAMVQFLAGQDEHPDDADSPLRDALMLPLADPLPEFEQRFGLKARTTFNMTETSCQIISDGYNLANTSSCGVLRPGFDARIVDEFDREVPHGEIGELVLRSDEPWTLMAGYWNKPEATAAAWRNQWLHTGDAFRRDAEGNYYFVDRMKDAIRRRGENISSAEVEADVNSHPAVLESAAVAVPSDQSEDEVMVYVVTRPGHSVTATDLLDYLAERMARFMVPRYVEFLDELPKTPTQKVQKAVLRTRGIGTETFDRTRPA
ncbi:AMP-binding protein [Nocardioides sp. AE5]|uniref:AMP-binding protein n=1 Tax=Nocardioides sp. AE5 TaxID=2962573 RepID=UPI002881764A|nr:AMP-binding protein [Nocardioides sp. AE5]MDT0202727.1 AMP-binding protein [Nocardioides sp. AE5]